MNDLQTALAATYAIPPLLFVGVVILLLWWALSGTRKEVAAATDETRNPVSRGMGCGTTLMGIILAIAILVVAASVMVPQ